MEIINSIMQFFGYIPEHSKIERLEIKIRDKKKKLNNLRKYIIDEAIRLDRVWEAGGNDYHLQSSLKFDKSTATELEVEINKLQDQIKDLSYQQAYKERLNKA